MGSGTTLRTTLAAFGLAILSACAQGATARGMTVTRADLPGTINPDLAGMISVTGTSGGKTTNPLWTSQIGDAAFGQALVASLRMAGMLAEGATAPLTLGARFVKVDQPMFGLDMTVTTVVQYTLVDARSGAKVIDEPITVSHTATFSDAFAGMTRLKLANEGSARKNIAAAIARINSIRRKAPAAPAM